MEWTTILNESIDYMEKHLQDDISADEVADTVAVSSFYYQRAFKMLTGYTVAEYIRNRRLTLAGIELASKGAKVIDVSLKYGYETPESFAKAFQRFHNMTPIQAKTKGHLLKMFKPLTVKIIVEGGNKMECVIEKKEAFKVMEVKETFTYETGYKEIPEFCNETMATYCQGGKPKLWGMYGISVEGKAGSGVFDYYIADQYEESKKIEEFEVLTISSYTWAVFTAIGALPTALQNMNTKIYSEWLPSNSKYEIAAGIAVEMYHEGDIKAADYKSEIWIPVKEK